MAEEAAPPLEFKDHEGLEAWLRTQQREVAVIIAARAALRVLPLFSEYTRADIGERKLAEHVASPFRAAAVAIAAAKYPERIDLATRAIAASNYARRAARATEKGGEDAVADAARAAYSALDAATESDPKEIAVGAVRAVIRAVGAARATGYDTAAFAVWSEVRADAASLGKGVVLNAFAELPLWTDGVAPSWMTAAWFKLRAAFPIDQDWDVWAKWYEGHLESRALGKEVELIYATVPPEKWDEGPAAANAWVKLQLTKLRTRVALERYFDENEADRRKVEQSSEQGPFRWDFFLSYSTKDEAFARFVDGVLRQAGHRVFAQFRDMPPAANFVHEMQNGLAHSKRVVALLSPNYVASDHCQAEWSAAYNDDPSGEKRRLVPLLIDPADLAPLARQIVFKSLVGLSKEEQAEAILDAIAPRPDTPGPPKSQTKGVFDLRPDGDQLKPSGNAPSDSAGTDYGGFTPQELWADSLHAFDDFADFAGDPATHNYLSRDIRRAAERLRALPRDLPSRPPLAADRGLGYVLRLIADADSQGELPEHGPIRYHRAELRGQYQRLAALWTDLQTYRRLAQIDRFEEPNEEARRAQEAILKETTRSEVASPELRAELADTLDALQEAQASIPPGADMNRRRARLYDATKSAVTQIVAIWNWAMNAAQKVDKDSADAERLIDNLEKLAKRISVYGEPLWNWVDKWWM